MRLTRKLERIERIAHLLRQDRGDTRWTLEQRQAVNDVFDALTEIMDAPVPMGSTDR